MSIHALVMEPFFRIIEFTAVTAGALYGILLARSKGLDFVGVFSLAFIVAFGGGTLRDLFLDRHPLFWIAHEIYPITVFGLALLSSFFRSLPKGLTKLLYLPDALGLGLFSVLGTQFALDYGATWFVASLLGVVTGSFGGVMGEVICNEVPSLFSSLSPLYATCAFVGNWLFLLLHYAPLSEPTRVLCGIAAIVVIRLIALRWNLCLPNRTVS